MIACGNDIDRGLRPHGRSGLKYQDRKMLFYPEKSPPTRAEWIEIVFDCNDNILHTSPPTRAEWIEMACARVAQSQSLGLRPHGRSGLKYL